MNEIIDCGDGHRVVLVGLKFTELGFRDRLRLLLMLFRGHYRTARKYSGRISAVTIALSLVHAFVESKAGEAA